MANMDWMAFCVIIGLPGSMIGAFFLGETFAWMMSDG